MIDRYSELAKSFRALGVTEQESPEKISILDEIETLADSRVFAFLAAVAGDPEEYDLARIKAIKALELDHGLTEEDRRAALRALARVLEADRDDEIRAYAARALANYVGDPEALLLACSLVADRDEDEDVRHNALFALERAGPSEEATAALKSCEDGSSLSRAAARVLAAWRA